MWIIVLEIRIGAAWRRSVISEFLFFFGYVSVCDTGREVETDES